jgi:hypothetical protein
MTCLSYSPTSAARSTTRRAQLPAYQLQYGSTSHLSSAVRRKHSLACGYSSNSSSSNGYGDAHCAEIDRIRMAKCCAWPQGSFSCNGSVLNGGSTHNRYHPPASSSKHQHSCRTKLHQSPSAGQASAQTPVDRSRACSWGSSGCDCPALRSNTGSGSRSCLHNENTSVMLLLRGSPPSWRLKLCCSCQADNHMYRCRWVYRSPCTHPAA